MVKTHPAFDEFNPGVLGGNPSFFAEKWLVFSHNTRDVPTLSAEYGEARQRLGNSVAAAHFLAMQRAGEVTYRMEVGGIDLPATIRNVDDFANAIVRIAKQRQLAKEPHLEGKEVKLVATEGKVLDELELGMLL